MSDGNELLYNFKRRSDESGLVCEDPSKTVQADAVDADINVIVRRFGITGKLPESLHIPQYADYESVFDFHSAQMAIADAEEQFMTIPAEVRARFNNDPGMFLAYAGDPNNYDGLVDLGLAKARVKEDNSSKSEIPPTT